MAALPRCLFSGSSVLKCNLITAGGSCMSIRGAKGGPGQSQGKPRKGRHFNILRLNPGTYVKERQVICTQRGLRYHPGWNVAIDPRDNALYSIREGTLVVTTEKLKPNYDHDLVEKYYSDLKGPMFKRFIHIVPKKEEITFKLVDLV
ncbi:39S ribosomal protein L27, mitochondrial [Halotydeus destructor]|nr:39S ribosomal protein L27, mitochondrial [Halotydeus destructor]